MGTDSFTYDANGNQTTRNMGGNSYTLSYDAENRQVSVSGAATASFVYDGDGTRVKGTIGGVTTTYVGNPSMLSGQVYFEWKTSTSDMVKYYYAGNTRVAIRMGSSTLNYLLGDHLGSTSITASSSGSRTAEIRYYPWGTERYTSGMTPTSYQFTGQWEESYINLYWYGSRWYDPALGRFIQADTLVPQQQGVQAWDRYAYTNNNPVNYIDPTGYKMVCEPEDPNCNQEARHELFKNLVDNIKTPDLTNNSNSTATSSNPPFDNNLGGNNPIQQSYETSSPDSPDYVEVAVGAGLLFVTEAVGIGLSIDAGIITTPAGPEISIPSFFAVYITYHEWTLPVFVIGIYMIYDGLYK